MDLTLFAALRIAGLRGVVLAHRFYPTSIAALGRRAPASIIVVALPASAGNGRPGVSREESFPTLDGCGKILRKARQEFFCHPARFALVLDPCKSLQVFWNAHFRKTRP